MPGPYSFSTSIAAGQTGEVAWANAVGAALNESAPTPTANVLVLRDAAGRAQVADPAAAADIATKGYVDNKLPLAYGGPAGVKVIPPGCSGGGTGGSIGQQPAGNRVVWFPVTVGACTITGFNVNVTTAGDGSSVIVVGLYSDWGGVRPAALLTTLGSVASTTTGMKTLTGASFAWAGGTLWVAVVEQGHTSTCAQVTNDTAGFSVATSQALNNSFQAIAQDSVSGSLPSSASGENALTATRPRVYLTIQ